ncbi:MAG: tetratricopeptide (TPR) repeat protein [Planctomycetota bacterium]|jgi:tetratricopeptide (TPR) repeat protein
MLMLCTVGQAPAVSFPVEWRATPGSNAYQQDSGAPNSGAAAQQNPRASTQLDAADSTRLDSWRSDLELDILEQILKDGPRLVSGSGHLAGSGEAVALVASAMFRAGQESLADSLLQQARPVDATGVTHIMLTRANFAIERDELQGAIELLLEKVGSAPRFADWPEAWLLCGRALTRMGEGRSADAYLQQFLSLAPLHAEAPSAWHMRAQHAIARRDPASAQDFRSRGQAAARWQSFMRARKLQKREDPSAPLPRLGIAQLWMQAEQLEAARTELEELVRLAPDFARGWSHLAQVRAQAGATEHAFEAYGRALQLDANSNFARLNRGLLARNQKQFELAESDLRQVFKTGDKDPERQLRAGWLLVRMLQDLGRGGEAKTLHDRYTVLGGTEAWVE